jgi:phosphoglycerate dehydrogenase-like enzyme
MNNKILVTDSLFIFDKQVKKLEAAGFEVERLDKVAATEAELIKAVKGKVGYILGGAENVTGKVLQAADKLKAVAFTGITYASFITAPAPLIKSKGIMVSNAPDGPTHAVAEWSITMALAMNRSIFTLGRSGSTNFLTTPGLEGQNIGIIGLGRIGSEIAQMLKPFRPSSVSYYSRNNQWVKIEYKPLKRLLRESDIVFLCVSGDVGGNFMSEDLFKLMKENALLVSFMHPGIVEEDALLAELKSGRLRAVSDYPMTSEEFDGLPFSRWYCFNGSNGFNTVTETDLVSDTVTESIINLIKTGTDRHRVV